MKTEIFIFLNVSAVDLSIAKGLRLGRSKIVGRCIGINPVNSQQIVYSEDTIEINVVPLNKVKIHTPLRKVQSGAILPASIWAIPNISPMILGKFDFEFFKLGKTRAENIKFGRCRNIELKSEVAYQSARCD